MEVAILDKRVRHNLSLFKHLVHREAEKRKRYFQVAKKSFRAFINRETGEFLFEDLEKLAPSADKWKAVVLNLKPDKEGAFVVSEEGGEVEFHCSDLQPLAYEVLTKTIHVLNQLAYDPRRGRNPFWVLRHVSQIDFIMTEEEQGRRSLIHEAWHFVDRYHAEYLLLKLPVGSYLFRKDEFAQILEDNLNKQYAHPVTCLTLTYNDWKQNIREKTLIFYENKWSFFSGDPSSLGPWFETVQELLGTLGDELQRPLLAG